MTRDFAAIRWLLWAVAPELLSYPLYVMRPPAGFPPLDNMRGVAVQPIDWTVRRDLIESHVWQGPGPTIIVSNALDIDDAESLKGLALHEAAHLLPAMQPPEDREPSGEEVEAQSQLMTAWAVEPLSQLLPEPWQSHDAQFIRRCLHLWQRAIQLGHEIALPAIGFAGSQYGLSGAWRYRRALGGEPASMIDATFAEINETQLPTEFAELWASDVAAWHRGEELRKQSEE